MTETSGVPSPCVGACWIDPDTRLCAGCARTGEEIATWPTLDDAARRALQVELQRRWAEGK